MVVCEDLPPAPMGWLAARWRVERCDPGTRRFEGLLGEARALVVRTYTRVDASLLALAPHLEVVGRAGVGLDNIDVEACRSRGVAVLSTPGANTQGVAEYVFRLVHACVRPVVIVDRAMGRAGWQRARRGAVVPRDLADLTLGIVGLGRIGSRVARIARGYGMEVVYHDVRRIPRAEREGARAVDIDELLASADVVSLHVDARGENRGLLGRAWLSRMRRGVVIVNTSRGMVVDAGALARFLARNPGATAAIDVHEPEPIAQGYPLLGLRNALLTPHTAAATGTSHENMGWVVRGVHDVLVERGVDRPVRRAGRAGPRGGSRSSRKGRK